MSDTATRKKQPYRSTETTRRVANIGRVDVAVYEALVTLAAENGHSVCAEVRLALDAWTAPRRRRS